MLHVHVVEVDHREVPELVRQAAANDSDPDTRIGLDPFSWISKGVVGLAARNGRKQESEHEDEPAHCCLIPEPAARWTGMLAG